MSETSVVETKNVPPKKQRHWIPLLYYFAVALIGLIIAIVGTFMLANGIKQVAFPQLSFDKNSCYHSVDSSSLSTSDVTIQKVIPDETSTNACTPKEIADKKEDAQRDGLNLLFGAFVSLIIGVPLFVWHLRAGRRYLEESH